MGDLYHGTNKKQFRKELSRRAKIHPTARRLEEAIESYERKPSAAGLTKVTKWTIKYMKELKP